MIHPFFFEEEAELIAGPGPGGTGPAGPGPAGPRQALASDINSVLDQAFPSEQPRDYLGASSLGDPCARRLQYVRRGTLPDAPLSGTQRRIFELGHMLEGRMAQWLQNAGFVLETRDPKTQLPFAFEQAGGQLRGHVDGIIRSGPLDLPYPLLREAKTMKAALWRDFVKHGLEISHRPYFVQVQAYMAYLQLEACLVTALNKDTAQLHHEKIPFQASVAAAASDRAVHVLQALAHNEILPRMAVRPDYFECKRCRFQKTCWGGAE